MITQTEVIPSNIIQFLKANTNLTLAVSLNNIPYCANCFYAYNETSNLIIFKSDRKTKHIQMGLENCFVAGTIAPDKLIMSQIKGLQFQGKLLEERGDLFLKAVASYYKKFPIALAMKGELWFIEPTLLKLTDNTFAFGKKSIWEREKFEES